MEEKRLDGDVAESALQASEARFARLAENVPGMVYEFFLTPTGEMGLRYVSQGCQAIFGVSPSEFQADIVGDRVPIALRPAFLEGIRESGRTLQPWAWSGPMAGPNGEEIWIDARSCPEREPDGTIVWYGLLTDATEFHRVAAESDEARLLLRTVLDEIPDVLFIKEGGRYTMFNRAGERFLGMAERDAVGRTDRELFGNEVDEFFHQDDLQTLAAGEMCENERELRDGNGDLHYFHTRKIPIRDEGRGKSYLLGISSDVTEFRRLEEHLRHVNESLEETVLLRTAELKATQEEILSRLGRAAAYRDGETGCHIRRMARTCEIVAREMGLAESDCALLLAAAPMHDIGKIAIPDGILLKPGRLDEAEMAVMRTHAEIGARMLAGGTSDLLVVAETIARTHHERWDGAGYPVGLAGEEIPLAGRIAAIADVYDALASERPYKRAWSVEAAVAEIRRSSGTHFDPAVVAAFLRALPAILAADQTISTEPDSVGLEKAA